MMKKRKKAKTELQDNDTIEKIVTKYNWELTEIVDGIYNDGIREFCFNGQLTNRNYREELIEILKKIRDKAKTELQDNDTIEKITIRR